MNLWQRFRNRPRWAQVLICVVVGLVGAGVAGATSNEATSTTATGPAPSEGDPTAILVGLRIEPEGARAGYDRDLFQHWVDDDSDGCNTREQVLIDESRSPAQVDPYGCKVVAGDWFSSYDGLTFSDPSELDIDHVVALAEAWDSGASGWDATRRRAFANDLDHPEALAAVSASSNRSKSDLDPGQWKPTREAAWCQYARDWVTVKKAWDLSADQNEVDDLKVMLRSCNGSSPSPGASVTIRSDNPAGPGELGWKNSPVWNNDGDTAHLQNAGGAVVSTGAC